MNVDALADVKLNWNPETTLALNFAIAFIMFGVALGLNKENFIELFKSGGVTCLDQSMPNLSAMSST